jgi:hypothetical protein
MDDDALIDDALDDALTRALAEFDAQFGLAGLIPPDDPSGGEAKEAVVRLFEQYLEAHAMIPSAGEALKVDAAFLARHGGPLLMHLLQGIAATIVSDDEAVGGVLAGQPEGPRVQVDLSELLRGVLGPPPSEPEGDEG